MMSEKNDLKYDVTIVICTYNPRWDKLKKTLDACITQKNINFQIVITDDGSPNNLFEQVRIYFQNNQFEDYKLSALEKNKGTVCNVLNGVESSEGEYVKLISPGDYFINENVLFEWMRFMKESACVWSFADAIYYLENGEYTKTKAYPQDVKVYKKGTKEQRVWNYVALSDIALGAAILSKRDTCLKYLRRVVDKVIYAEDNIWRIMMYDGIVGEYYSQNVIFYEWGAGISTSQNDKWSVRLQRDWQTANEIMINEKKRTPYQDEICKEFYAKKNNNKVLQYLYSPKKHRKIINLLKKKFVVRYTSCPNKKSSKV